MSPNKDEMEELIEYAKKQVIDWYNPDTKRRFIEKSIYSSSLRYGEPSGSLTKLIVLEGGEAKGTIIADYYNGKVLAYDHSSVRFEIWKTLK